MRRNPEHPPGAPLSRWRRRPLRAFGRQLRFAFGRDLGPLGRQLDRVRSRGQLLTVLGLLTALLLGSLLAVRGVASAPRQVAARAAQLHRVRAEVLGPPRPDASSPGFRFNGGDRVTVAWEYPAGHSGTGRVALNRPASAGATLPVWVTDDGRLGSPPPTTAGLVLLAIGFGGGAWLLASAAVLAGHAMRRRALERRCLREWAEGWSVVEPRWSGRLNGRPGNPAP
ncbi:hypothetical protein OG455_35855 [Kitasatospora sp. NBC_01287]|uniref:Rv1733c family protein n=1 Tax=Kitasatospora sp. NBC_01287 TaxID=2903573 RepID=UPI002259627D|nr:hypothetical protein [Kitasatospora sp. NBC_01287]MCX4750819.1 hypothetical protein [Kitasatospora sp. NBC_01287]